LGSNVSEEPAAFILRANSTGNSSEPLVLFTKLGSFTLQKTLILIIRVMPNPQAAHKFAANWHHQVTYSALFAVETAKVVS
jgi:hypothetical protein